VIRDGTVALSKARPILRFANRIANALSETLGIRREEVMSCGLDTPIASSRDRCTVGSEVTFAHALRRYEAAPRLAAVVDAPLKLEVGPCAGDLPGRNRRRTSRQKIHLQSLLKRSTRQVGLSQ